MADSSKNKIHVVGLDLYLKIGLALLVLTAVTVYVSFIDLGPWNVAVALLIAAIKATLVILFFMHLYYDHKLYLFVFLTAIIFLAIFIGFTMFDTLNRGDINTVVDKPIDPTAVIYEASHGNLFDSTVNIDSLSVLKNNSIE